VREVDMNIRIIFGLRRFVAAFLVVFFVVVATGSSVQAGAEEVLALRVTRVVDGDTIWTKGGEQIRYVGLDTPERDEPFYAEARRKNKALVGGKVVEVVVCKDEPRDRYGRLLAWISVDGLDVGAEILKVGLARLLIIPPCGLVRAAKYRALEREAKRLGLGIWGNNDKKLDAAGKDLR
jgi:micrococcal nuclease